MRGFLIFGIIGSGSPAPEKVGQSYPHPEIVDRDILWYNYYNLFINIIFMTISIIKKIIAAVIVAAVIVGAVVYIYRLKTVKPYSVVYLATGEIYIGKLSTFPQFELKDAYLLQTVKDKDDPAKSNFQLTPLTDTLWSPVKINLNSRQVVFYGPLRDNSRAAEALRNAKK